MWVAILLWFRGAQVSHTHFDASLQRLKSVCGKIRDEYVHLFKGVPCTENHVRALALNLH